MYNPAESDTFKLAFTRAAVGSDPTVLAPSQFEGTSLVQCEARLTATPGQVAACVVRPTASVDPGSVGYPVGGEISLTGTADGSGFVQVDGFPFLSGSLCYGFEVVSISGGGASVSARVASVS